MPIDTYRRDVFLSPLNRFTTAQLCRRLLHRPSHDVGLHAAAREADLDRLRNLLGQYVELDGAGEKGQTALHLALRSGFPEAVWLGSLYGLPSILPRYPIRILLVDFAAMLLFYALSLVTTTKGPSIAEAATSFRGNSESAVLMLLDSGFRPQHNDMLLLWIDAVRKGHTGVCSRMARMGWDVDIPFADPDSPEDRQLVTTALLYASAGSHKDLVLFLLGAGADPTLLDSWGRSCLLLAAMSKEDNELNSAILEALLNTDATRYLNVDHLPGGHGLTAWASRRTWGWPLGVVCGNMRVDAVRALLDAGADPNLLAGFGMTALHVACDNYHNSDQVAAMVKMLLKHKADVNTVTSNSWTAVGRVCNAGISPGALSLLLAAGAQVEFGAGENTPLQIAARYDVSDGRLVELLLQHGANANAMGGKFGTALLAALARPNYEGNEELVLKVVSDLLEWRADVNAAPNGCDPPITQAARKNMTQVAELLLKKGAVFPMALEVDVRDGDGGSTSNHSVLHVPILGRLFPNQDDMFRLLLKHGASPNGYTALDGEADCRKTILGYACSSSRNEYVTTARLLLESGADPNAPDVRGKTPMQHAAHALSVEHVRMLLDYNAGPPAQEGVHGGSPWYSLCKDAVDDKACLCGRDEPFKFLEICELLKSKWAVDLAWTRDESGKNSLHYLAGLGNETYRTSPAAKLIGAFLSRYGTGVSPEVFLDEDGNGHTALEIASATGDETVMTVLVAHIFKMHLDAAMEEGDEHYRDIRNPASFVSRNSDFMRRLLAHADHEGRTALHIAASEGRIHACRFLAVNPYALEAPRLSNSGQSPADCAKANGHHRVAEYLSTFKGAETTADDLAKRKTIFAMVAPRLCVTRELVNEVLDNCSEDGSGDDRESDY
ncbi:ankyrin repeat-containing domain protein [Durotheca rogersii]|uniref:ankyrin repeat-containing domain protein n=1 Tax=Durotheca rogersii TaxID=419775 RepID=UPI0022210777|nr:ankyrin repeat-containing domain protein [Durotheca rogersii]KAI5855076.1 ankyrin repeat-containing domain protein [Durotheca rogersii]